ncbi:hypothetical protein DAEQUDRAFT_531885 [Daedalea quercina L-15889]|uniref:Uncharacterized protein n=1 Tax=Daedalea quercina L-15889 TaxID=1314783 RepID=A0A165M8U7_9APHY|nr:hypothetical protein DAEQUDRAFT_531885 [Daedalea quercina L-15889]
MTSYGSCTSACRHHHRRERRFKASRVSQVARELPTEGEAKRDMKNLLNSLLCFVRVIITSAPYHAILSDLSSFSRETVADVASDVGHLAAQVQSSAIEVERSVRPRCSSGDAKGKEREFYGKDEQSTYRNPSQGKQGPVSAYGPCAGGYSTPLVFCTISEFHHSLSFMRIRTQPFTVLCKQFLVLFRRYTSKARRVTYRLSLPSCGPSLRSLALSRISRCSWNGWPQDAPWTAFCVVSLWL